MNDVIRSLWAAAYTNGDFFFIETNSGYRSNRADPRGSQHLLSPDADDKDLGIAVRSALASSRFVLAEPRPGIVYPPEVEFDMDLYDYKRSGERYAEWVSMLMSRYSYKNKRALFKNMKNCNIELHDRQIVIRPSRHEKLEGWGREESDGIEDVYLAASSADAEVGAGLRLAFSRCK